jgi:hypothetical protein
MTLTALTGFRFWYPPRRRRPLPAQSVQGTVPHPLQRRHAAVRL